MTNLSKDSVEVRRLLTSIMDKGLFKNPYLYKSAFDMLSIVSFADTKEHLRKILDDDKRLEAMFMSLACSKSEWEYTTIERNIAAERHIRKILYDYADNHEGHT
jgi:hypothetical protein